MKVVPTFQKIHKCDFVRSFENPGSSRFSKNPFGMSQVEVDFFFQQRESQNFLDIKASLFDSWRSKTSNGIYHFVWFHGDYEL